MTGMLIGAAVVYVLFFLMCFFGTGGDARNMSSFYSYPDAVQEKAREIEELRKLIPKKKPQSVTCLSNLILFTVVFLILGVLLKVRQFLPALCYFLIVGEGLNLFDLVVIDLCWWRNTSRTKFSAIPDKALYRDMKKHVGSFLRGIPIFAVSALLAAGILSVIPLK